jgi:DNA (cytosine-5)-methyltransferase 1
VRAAELFAGIGGIGIGLERAGIPVAWRCEIDPDRRALLEQRYPGVPVFPDVGTLRGADAEPVALLAGGFPCQDVSDAGRRAGIDGEQSGLWTHFARLVRELRPRYVLVENVPGLLVRGMGRVVGNLAASGYDAEWDCLPAAAFGAPHLRARIWLLAYPRGQRDEADDTVFAGRPVAQLRAGWPAEPGLPRVDDGTPAWLVHAAGNAAVPACAEHIGRCILDHERSVSAR